MIKAPITIEEFSAIDGSRRIIDSSNARRFCKLTFEVIGTYVLSWRSDLIEPLIQTFPNQIWIGIDQKLVCLSSEHGNIIISHILTSNFSSFISTSSGIVVVCECDIFIFNKDLSLKELINTPHIINEAYVDEGMLIVTTLEGQTLSIDLSPEGK